MLPPAAERRSVGRRSVTLEDLGNTGEFLGAIAVLISLIYLALQIRHNTMTVRAVTSAAVSESLARVTEVVGADPQTARVYTLGLAGDSTLSPEESFQFNYLFATYMRRVENAYYQQLRGFVDSEHWQTTDRILSLAMELPGARRKWEGARSVYSDQFVAYVDRILIERGTSPAAAQQADEVGR